MNIKIIEFQAKVKFYLILELIKTETEKINIALILTSEKEH